MLRLVLFSCCVVVCVGYPNCGENEEMQCVQACPPEKTCRNRDIRFSCVQVVEPCHHICACKPGFLRNALGQCITNEECDMCQGENEFFDCGTACDNECATIDTQNRTNCPIKSFVCNRKCYCEDGFARDNENKCIPIEKCHSQNIEGSSSKIVKDGSRVRRFSIIPEMCQGENEFFDCGSACDNECATLSTQNRTNCPIVNIMCNRKCYCEDGFARDDENKCIPIEKCHSQNIEGSTSKIAKDESRVRRYSDIAESICTGENEVHTDCMKSCPPNTCLSIVASFKCDSTEPCKKGCLCKPGYLRQHPDSPCIPICQCNEMKHAPECKVLDSINKKYN